MKLLLVVVVVVVCSLVAASLVEAAPRNSWLSLMLNRPFQLDKDQHRAQKLQPKQQSRPQAPSSRVSGGDAQTDLTYQFQVQITDFASGQHLCGAVMISATWALTAAHCVVGRDPARLSVPIGGDHDGFAGVPYTAALMQVGTIVPHPNYSPSTLANNLALVQLTQSFVLNPKAVVRATTVHLPEAGQKFTDFVNLVGFGSISSRVPREESQKRIVSIPIISLAKCRTLYGQNLIADQMLCAGDSYKGMGLCNGDSGSGLTQFDEELNAEVLVGIGSFGFECGHGKFPSVFTAVADYISWIHETVPATATAAAH